MAVPNPLMSADFRALNVVAMGGGTGLSTLLRGLKQHVTLPGDESYGAVFPGIADLSAIVTVSDDGGSSGRLRKELNIPPPGDIRSCIVALSEEEATLSQLFRYRFQAGEGLEGHSFGNLFLSAMTAITGDFSQAVKQSSAILATRGHIYPATTSNAQLYAIMDDYSVVRGETNITASQRRIVELRMAPANARALPMALAAIRTPTDYLIWISIYQPRSQPAGAGCVWTTKNARALKVFVCNLMTTNESLGLSALDHIRALYKHARHQFFDYALVNCTAASAALVQKYAQEQQSPIVVDAGQIEALGVKPVLGEYLLEETIASKGLVARHDTARVAQDLLRIMMERHQSPVSATQE